MRKLHTILVILGVLFVSVMIFTFETSPSPTTGDQRTAASSTNNSIGKAENVPAVTSRLPRIESLSPSEGPVGNTIAIIGSGFSKTTNRINFAGKNNVAVAVRSANGNNIQFTIPVTPCTSGNACNPAALKQGTYSISVSNEFGTSNEILFTVLAAVTNKTIILGLDQTGNVEDVQITPIHILEDSRCPIGVYCIQAGRVVVETRVITPNSEATVEIQAGQEKTFKTSDGHEVRITEVEPLRRSGKTINDEDYRVTFQVVK